MKRKLKKIEMTDTSSNLKFMKKGNENETERKSKKSR